MWSLSLPFLRSCFPAKTDTYASGTVSQNKFSPHSCFWSFSFFLTTTEKKQIKRRNLCTDISSESCLLFELRLGKIERTGSDQRERALVYSSVQLRENLLVISWTPACLAKLCLLANLNTFSMSPTCACPVMHLWSFFLDYNLKLRMLHNVCLC